MDQEAGFMVNFINSYFIALGVLIGGALIGGSEHIWQANPRLQPLQSLPTG